METEARPVLTKVENESQMISIPYRIEMISLFLCDLKENKISDITFIGSVEGVLNPLFMLKPEDHKLKDFQWHILLKPLTKEDIFKKHEKIIKEEEKPIHF